MMAQQGVFQIGWPIAILAAVMLMLVFSCIVLAEVLIQKRRKLP